ncbi:hypothetical protein Tco_1115557 [Tanacetum coccineum]
MSPSSSVLEDWGTNPSDSKNELSLRTFSVMNEIDGSGGMTWIFSGLSFYPSSFSSGLSLWDSPCCLGWIVMALIEPWIWVEHYGFTAGNGSGSDHWIGTGVTKIVLLGLKSVSLTSHFISTRGCIFNKGLFRIFHAILSVVEATADLTWGSDFVHLSRLR